MGYNRRSRNFLKLLDFTTDEIRFLLEPARTLKAAKYAGFDQAENRMHTFNAIMVARLRD